MSAECEFEHPHDGQPCGQHFRCRVDPPRCVESDEGACPCGYWQTPTEADLDALYLEAWLGGAR